MTAHVAPCACAAPVVRRREWQSISEWVDQRGGEERLRAELQADSKQPGSSALLAALDDETTSPLPRNGRYCD